MNKKFTPKQIAKYKRQKYISALNKCTKNLYKIFKDKNSDYNSYQKKFIALKEEIDKFKDKNIYIHTDHLKKIEEYIENLYQSTILAEFSKQKFLEIKDKEASNLNRLQKIKNRSKYNKEKYKNFF